jgi:hypothetical protein
MLSILIKPEFIYHFAINFENEAWYEELFLINRLTYVFLDVHLRTKLVYFEAGIDLLLVYGCLG